MKRIIILLSIIALSTCFTNFSVPNNATATLLLNLHNIERAAVGVYNLTWSDDLTKASQDFANTLAAKNGFHHSGTGWVGENIAKATFRKDLTQYLVSLWSSQKKYFNPTVKYGASSSTDPKREVGHYTQMIWSMSHEVGCGIANTSTSSILVCQYRYAGNFVNEWVYKPDEKNPKVAAKPVVNPAALLTPPPQNSYPTVLDNATSTLIL